MSLQRLYDTWKDRVDFHLVYLREAHPADDRRPSKTVKIEQPKTQERRVEVAQQCTKSLSISIPVLVDDLEDRVSRAYNAHPDRLFVLGADGRVAYRGARGPRGFHPEELEAALPAIVAAAAGPKPIETK